MAYIEGTNRDDVLTGTPTDDNGGTPEMMQTLTDAELDVVSAGAASATLSTASLIAIGLNDAMVTAENVEFTQTVDGLEPSNTAFVSVHFTATSN